MTRGSTPRPRRTGPTWKQFLTPQAHGILAADFVHVDTVFLRRIYGLIVIEHGTRRVHLAGITANPDGAWMTRAARNFRMDLGQRATSIKFLIRDRAGQFTGSFDVVFTAAGIRILTSPPQAPRAKAICETVIGTLRREVLDRLPIVLSHIADQPRRAPDPPKQVLRGLTHEYQIAARQAPCPLRDDAGHQHNRVFEPNRLLVAHSSLAKYAFASSITSFYTASPMLLRHT